MRVQIRFACYRDTDHFTCYSASLKTANSEYQKTVECFVILHKDMDRFIGTRDTVDSVKCYGRLSFRIAFRFETVGGQAPCVLVRRVGLSPFRVLRRQPRFVTFTGHVNGTLVKNIANLMMPSIAWFRAVMWKRCDLGRWTLELGLLSDAGSRLQRGPHALQPHPLSTRWYTSAFRVRSEQIISQ